MRFNEPTLQIKSVFDTYFEKFNYTRDDTSSGGCDPGATTRIDQTCVRCHFLDSESVPVLNTVVNA